MNFHAFFDLEELYIMHNPRAFSKEDRAICFGNTNIDRFTPKHERNETRPNPLMNEK
jgi:hypothetical protein